DQCSATVSRITGCAVIIIRIDFPWADLTLVISANGQPHPLNTISDLPLMAYAARHAQCTRRDDGNPRFKRCHLRTDAEVRSIAVEQRKTALPEQPVVKQVAGSDGFARPVRLENGASQLERVFHAHYFYCGMFIEHVDGLCTPAG